MHTQAIDDTANLAFPARTLQAATTTEPATPTEPAETTNQPTADQGTDSTQTSSGKNNNEPKENVQLARTVEIPINCLYMILGLPMCFLGYKYLKIAVIVVGTVGGNILL